MMAASAIALPDGRQQVPDQGRGKIAFINNTG